MKILIFTKNWVGDMLFQMPAIDAIAAQWPKAEIVCLVPGRCREMLRSHPRVNRVIVFDEKKEHRSWVSRLSLAMTLRKEKWDQAFLFHRSRTRAFVALLAGAKRRVGYGKGRKWLLTDAVSEPAGKLHHVDYFLNLVQSSGVKVPSQGVYHFYRSDEDDRTARDVLSAQELYPGRFVCFHLGANWEPKRWPPAHFASLAEKLFVEYGFTAVLTGAPDDKPLAAQVMKQSKIARVISLMGQTRLGVLGSLFRLSAFVVSGDSGPMHIAAGSGARVAALFGPTDPAQTGPRGEGDSFVIHKVPEGFSCPWYGKDLPHGGWLSLIQPDEVMTALKRKGWLTQPAAQQPGAGR